MIIDFHTHIFPDKIARSTVDFLANKASVTPHFDGSERGLASVLRKAGVDIAVTLPVVTRPEQFGSINRFARAINEKYSVPGAPSLISFAGIHPACDDIKGKMRFIKESGFLGVKLHPDYQGTFFDDEGYVEIIRAAAELDLIVVTHAGVDIGFRGEEVRCTPGRIVNVLERAPYSKLVLAHLGSNEMFDEVYRLIAGKNVYLDTAYILRYIEPDMFRKILERHGDDKVLFATDAPWSDVANDIKILKSMNLPKETEERLFSENAAKLLGLRNN